MSEIVVDRVITSITRHGLLSGGERVVVAVSGGADSLCMLDVFLRLRERFRLTLFIGHVNHQLRPEAAFDAQHLAQLAERLGLPYEGIVVDVHALAKAEGLSIEHAAREVRYRALEEMAQGVGARHIAVAHTADDQVETIILNFLRGGGPEGLAGMPVSRPFFGKGSGRIIRPLIDLTKDETEAYCHENNLPIRLDATNLEPITLRNRIRHEILPFLTREQPALARILLRQAGIFRAEDAYLREITDTAFKESLVSGSDVETDDFVFSARKITALPLALGRRVIREALRNLRIGRLPLALEQVDRVLWLAREGETGKKLDLGDDLWTERNYDALRLYREEEQILHAQSPSSEGIVSLHVPGEVEINGVHLIAERIPRGSVPNLKADDGRRTAFIDAAALTGETLSIRAPQSGDRFIPLGSSGSMKLHDFFINLKIPREARTKALVVCDNDRIVWLVGWRVDDRFKITDQTTEIARLHVR